jgi:CRISPR system Cascade subunit CasA
VVHRHNPPLLNFTQEHDPAKAQRIAECRREAEHIAQRLATVAKQAWDAATHSRTTQPPWAHRALTRYWPKAEKVFWRLLQEPDTTAFAAAAAALRTEAHADRPRRPGVRLDED